MDKNQTHQDIIEKALSAFWQDYGQGNPIKARHTEVKIQPKLFIGGKLNPQVAQKIVEVYLAQVTMEEIMNGKIVISEDAVQIKDESGKVKVEVKDKKFIKKMINQATVILGRKLAEKKMIPPKKHQIYAYGDIQEGLIKLLNHAERNDSKNLVKDATSLLVGNKQFKR